MKIFAAQNVTARQLEVSRIQCGLWVLENIIFVFEHVTKMIAAPSGNRSKIEQQKKGDGASTELNGASREEIPRERGSTSHPAR